MDRYVYCRDCVDRYEETTGQGIEELTIYASGRRTCDLCGKAKPPQRMMYPGISHKSHAQITMALLPKEPTDG